MGIYNKTNKVIVFCKNCNKDIFTTEYLISINKSKFCSKKCCDLSKIGAVSKKITKDIEKQCILCKSIFYVKPSRINKKYCNRVCSDKSKVGVKLSEATRLKLSCLRKGEKHHFFGKKLPQMSGENNHRWIKDRTLLKKYTGSEERRSPAYKFWRKEVWVRDNFLCRIADINCDGKIEAHHILGWSEHPELRYKVNNGITLCHAHHPRKRAEEKRLIPTFQELVSVLN